MSFSEADEAGKRAAEAKVKATKMARAADAARAEADAAEKAAEETQLKVAYTTAKKTMLVFIKEEKARRLAAREKAANEKMAAAKTAWEAARDTFRGFESAEAAIKPALYWAVLAAASAVGKDGIPET